MNRAITTGPDAVPVGQDIEQRHREGEPGVKAAPGAMARLFELTHRGQHRAHGFDDHPHVPRAALADLQVGRVAHLSVKARIAQDNHLIGKLRNQPVNGVVRHMRGGRIPRHNLAELIDDVDQLAANDPAMVGETFGPQLPIAAMFPPRMDQFDPVAVDHPQRGRLGQEVLRPVLMGGEQAKQAGALGQARKPGTIIAPQPAVKRAATASFEGEQQGQRDDLAGIELRLRMFGQMADDHIYPIEQANDKIGGGHTVLLTADV